MNLKNYFDRVVVVNLKRRPDRLACLKTALRDCSWPFQQPIVFDAVDGNVVPCPHGWLSEMCIRDRGIAWPQSHESDS